MLTPEQQARYNELLLKQYKGILTAEEQTDLEALRLLRDAPETANVSAETLDLSPNLARLAGEIDHFDAELNEMSGKISGRQAIAEAITELGEHDAEKHQKPDHDAH